MVAPALLLSVVVLHCVTGPSPHAIDVDESTLTIPAVDLDDVEADLIVTPRKAGVCSQDFRALTFYIVTSTDTTQGAAVGDRIAGPVFEVVVPEGNLFAHVDGFCVPVARLVGKVVAIVA